MKLAASMVALATPCVALACAVCAQDRTPHAALFISALIAAPYLVAVVVVRAIRSSGEDEP